MILNCCQQTRILLSSEWKLNCSFNLSCYNQPFFHILRINTKRNKCNSTYFTGWLKNLGEHFVVPDLEERLVVWRRPPRFLPWSWRRPCGEGTRSNDRIGPNRPEKNIYSALRKMICGFKTRKLVKMPNDQELSTMI